MLVVAVISVDCTGCTVLPDSKKTELGSSNQEALLQVKIPGQLQCHDHAWKCVPTAIFDGVDISEVPGCHLLWQMSSQ